MNSHTAEWRVPAWAWGPIGIAIVAEAVSNALRAYGLGAHLDHFTFACHGHSISVAGAVLVLAAVAISLSQARAAWVALTPGPARQRIIAGVSAALLLSISVTAMVSHIFEAQRAKVTDEAGERGAFDRASAEYTKLSGQLDALKKYGEDGQQLPRDGRVIQAAINKLPINMRLWRRSKQCTDITRPDTKESCQPVLALYEERGAHASLVQLEPKLATAKAELAALKRPEKVQETEATVAGIWAWIMGLGVVMVATFGTVLFARVTVADDKATEAQPATKEQRLPVELPSELPVRLPDPRDSNQTSFPTNQDVRDRATVASMVSGNHPGNRHRNRHRNRHGNRDSGNHSNGNRPGNRDGGDRVYSKTEAEAELVTRLALGETIPSQDTLASHWLVNKGTVSKWLRDWERRQLISARRQVGRYKQLAKV